MIFEPATISTMYFIGVTTTKSSIMQVFPKWAQALNLNGAILKGIDIDIHADPEIYREVVSFIKDDPLSLGALVTTHKIDLYEAAEDLFDYLDPYARQFNELSSISKDGKKLCGHAKDPITCGMALEEFVPKNYWKENPDASVFILGAGGSAISMCSYFTRQEFNGNYPKRIIVSNRSQQRLESIREINQSLNPGSIEFEYYLTPEPGQNDKILSELDKGSLVINATGLGKDRPGSPLLDSAVFPENGIVWEINYRGELQFLKQALKQKEERNLTVSDGWMYFIYGWTQVIAEVFHMPIQGDKLKLCSEIAKE